MKEFSSNVEDNRLSTEEYILNVAKPNVLPMQIWRDAEYIPDSAAKLENGSSTTVEINGKSFKHYVKFSIELNDIMRNIVSYYDKMPLFKISGTENAYACNDYLTDIIPSYFGKHYLYKLYIGDLELPFGRGDPDFESESGLVKILDKEINDSIDDNLYISFYKYTGRKGYSNIENLPYVDTLTHFKQSKYDENTASLLVRNKGHKNYILADDGYYDNEDTDSRVLVTQESIEDVIANGLTINGGVW